MIDPPNKIGFFAGIPPTHLLLLFIRAINMGVFAPVLSLMLLEQGCTIATLPLVIGVFGVTVVVLEFPSGAYADMFGRRRTYLTALVFQLISYVLLLVGGGVPALVVSCLFRGAGTAFCSGSMEALVLEQTVARQGQESLPAVSRVKELLETGGVAAGALIGGAIPLLTGRYSSVALFAAAMVAVQATLCLLFVREEAPSGGRPASILVCIRECGSLLAHDRLVLALILSAVGLGFLLFTIESYWQPAFLGQGGGNWALGPISFAGYGISLLGSILAAAVLSRRKKSGWWGAFLLLRFALAGTMAVFALQSRMGMPVVFTVSYLAVYLVLGCGNIPKDALLNAAIPNRLRSSILSLSSLTLRFGGLVGSLFASLAVNRVGIGGVWLAASCAATLILLACVLLNRKPAKTKAPETAR